MLVNNVEDMEEIVEKTQHLSWSGWDVVSVKQDDYAEYLVDGYFDRNVGKWYRKSVYSCGENGWDIPDSVLI